MHKEGYTCFYGIPNPILRVKCVQFQHVETPQRVMHHRLSMRQSSYWIYIFYHLLKHRYYENEKNEINAVNTIGSEIPLQRCCNL